MNVNIKLKHSEIETTESCIISKQFLCIFCSLFRHKRNILLLDCFLGARHAITDCFSASDVSETLFCGVCFSVTVVGKDGGGDILVISSSL